MSSKETSVPGAPIAKWTESPVGSQLAALQQRVRTGANLGIPAHLLGGSLRLQAQQRADALARSARRASIYRPHLRAAATSQAVTRSPDDLGSRAVASGLGASSAAPIPNSAAPITGVQATPPTSNRGQRNSLSGPASATGSAITPTQPRTCTSAQGAQPESSSAKALPDGNRTAHAGTSNGKPVAVRQAKAATASSIVSKRAAGEDASADFDWTATIIAGFEWANLLERDMPRYYRLSGRDMRRMPGSKGSAPEPADLREARAKIQEAVARESPRAVAERLLAKRPPSAAVAREHKLDSTFLATIYTPVGAKDPAVDTLPGRAAVLIGLCGALAIERFSSPDTLNAESATKMTLEEEAQLDSAVILADALLQYRGLEPLSHVELRYLVLLITTVQAWLHPTWDSPLPDCNGAASSLGLLVPLARALASYPWIGPCVEAEVCSVYILAMSHQQSVMHAWPAAVRAANASSSPDPRTFLEHYFQELEAAVTTKAECDETHVGAEEDRPAIDFTTVDVWCLRRLWEMLAPHLIASGRRGAGRGGPLRLAGMAHQQPERRADLLRTLLSVGLDEVSRSLVAVGKDALQLLTVHTAAMGYLRRKTAEASRKLLAAPAAAVGTALDGEVASSAAADGGVGGAAAVGPRELPAPSRALNQGPIALRLMTSAQLVVQHMEHWEGGPPQGLDPFWLPPSFTPTLAATLLPLPAAFAEHVAAAKQVARSASINYDLHGRGLDAHSCKVRDTFLHWLEVTLKLNHVARLEGRCLQQALLYVAQVHMQLMGEGLEVLVVPQLAEATERLLLGAAATHVIEAMTEEVKTKPCDAAKAAAKADRSVSTQDKSGGGGACGETATPGGDGLADEPDGWVRVRLEDDTEGGGCAAQDPASKPHVRLTDDWPLRRRCAINRAACTLLSLDVSTLHEEQAEARMQRDLFARLGDIQQGDDAEKLLRWAAGQEAKARDRRRVRKLLTDGVDGVTVELLVFLCERGQGGAAGRPLPLPNM